MASVAADGKGGIDGRSKRSRRCFSVATVRVIAPQDRSPPKSGQVSEFWEQSMEWLLTVLAVCVLAGFFRRAYKRRLAALSGPWIMEKQHRR